MLKKLFELLKGGNNELKYSKIDLTVDKDRNPIDDSAFIAVLALLIEISGSDSEIAYEEAQTIVAVMTAHFNLSEEEVPILLEGALNLRKQNQKIDAFVKTINSIYSEKQKMLIYAMIWKVVTADGTIENFEKKMAVQLRFRLQLSEEYETEAKRLVSEGIV